MSRAESAFKKVLIAKSTARLFDDGQSKAQTEWFSRKSQADAEFAKGVAQTCRAISSAQTLEQDAAFMGWVDDVLGDTKPASRQVSNRWRVGLAASFLLAIGLGVLTWIGLGSSSEHGVPDRYVARVGELKNIRLSDKTSITLNTATQIFTDIDADARRVILDRGEAYFDVAKDESRPFRVELGGKSITVLGTRFIVRRDPTRFTLAVADGMVLVHESAKEAIDSAPHIEATMRGHSFAPRRVGAGWVVEYDLASDTLKSYRSDNIERRMSWRNGVLHFAKTPLADVVYELNRYSAKKIMIRDSELVSMPVTASLRIDQLGSALSGLKISHNLTIVHHFDHIAISLPQEQ